MVDVDMTIWLEYVHAVITTHSFAYIIYIIYHVCIYIYSIFIHIIMRRYIYIYIIVIYNNIYI